MDLSVKQSFRSKRHVVHREHLQRKVGERRSPACSVSSYSIQYQHVHSVFLFPRSLAEWVQFQPPFVRKDLKLNTVALAVSSCRVSEMNQDWKQAVRLWSWHPCYLPVCLSREAGQTRYLGKNTEVVPRAPKCTQLKTLRVHRILFSPFEKGFQWALLCGFKY